MKKGVDYIGVGCGAMIFRDDGKFLLIKRGKESRNEVGKWNVPGGGVEFGETLEEATKREIKEELNIEIDIIEFLELVDHIIPEENQHWISPTFIAKYQSGELKNMEPHKIDEIRWFDVDDVDENTLTISFKHSFETYKMKYLKKKEI